MLYQLVDFLTFYNAVPALLLLSNVRTLVEIMDGNGKWVNGSPKVRRDKTSLESVNIVPEPAISLWYKTNSDRKRPLIFSGLF